MPSRTRSPRAERELKAPARHVSLPVMRTMVAALASVAMAGCAASPSPRTVAGTSAPPPARHPVVAEAAPAGSDVTEEQRPNGEHATRQTNRALGWVVLSLGIEGGILATVTSFMMLHQNRVRSDDCVDKVCSPAGLAANGTLGNLAGWNAAAWGVAAVGVGTGLFILLTNPTDNALGTQVGIGPTASGSALLVRGAF